MNFKMKHSDSPDHGVSKIMSKASREAVEEYPEFKEFIGRTFKNAYYYIKYMRSIERPFWDKDKEAWEKADVQKEVFWMLEGDLTGVLKENNKEDREIKKALKEIEEISFVDEDDNIEEEEN